jgi:hypothetical protein
MQDPAILAAKHAALGSGVGLGAVPITGLTSLDGVAVGMLLAGVGLAVLSPRRLARFRQRVDGLLTGMLSDDAETMTPAAAAGQLTARRAERADQRFPAAAWSGDHVDALAPARSLTATRPRSEALQASRWLPTRWSGQMADEDPWPPAGWTEVAGDSPGPTGWGDDVDDEHAPKPGEPRADTSFWGPSAAADLAPAAARRSTHRLGADPYRSRRAKPRHAAPPATFAATVARGLTGAKLTSGCAAHAAG